MSFTDDTKQNNASSRIIKQPGIAGKTGLELYPRELYFGSLVVGEDQLIRTFTVTNVGSRTLRIENIEIQQESDQFLLLGSFPEVLRPQESFEVGVKYQSDALGLKVGTVVIDTNEDSYYLGVSGRVVGSLYIEQMWEGFNALILQESLVRADADGAEATQRLLMRAELEGSFSAQLEEERTARVTYFEAEVVARQQLSATLNDLVMAEIEIERTARVTADTAEATAREAMVAEVTDAFDAAMVSGSAIVEEARVAAELAQTSAEAAATLSSNYKDDAEAAATAANGSATLASDSSAEAAAYSSLAAGFADTAEAEADISASERVLANNARSLAETARDLSATYRDQAEGYKTGAQTQAGLSESSRVQADAHRASAETSSNLSATYRNQSQGFRNEAEGFKNTAQTQAGLAETSRVNADSAKASAETARDLSASYRDQSQGYRNEAEGFKNTASSQASAASGSAVTASGHAASALSYATLSAQYGSGGGNLLPQSDFVRDTAGYDIYTPYSTANFEFMRDLAGVNWRPENEHTIGIRQVNATAGLWAQWHSFVNIEGNKWYEFSAYVADHRCANELIIEWYDKDGGGFPAAGAGSAEHLEGGNRIAANNIASGFQRTWVKAQAPAGAVRAACVFRKYATNTGGDSYAWWTRPMMREVPSTFTSPAVYAPSSGRASVEQLSGAVATAEGKLSAYWQVDAVAGGRAQLKVWADAVGGGGVDIIGDVKISGSLVVDGTINTSQLAGNSVIQPNSAMTTGSILIPTTSGPSSRVTLQSLSVTSAAGYTVGLSYGADISLDITDPSGVYFADVWFELYRNSTRIHASQSYHLEGTYGDGFSFFFGIDDAPGAGSFTYTVQVYTTGAGCRCYGQNRLLRAPVWKR